MTKTREKMVWFGWHMDILPKIESLNERYEVDIRSAGSLDNIEKIDDIGYVVIIYNLPGSQYIAKDRAEKCAQEIAPKTRHGCVTRDRSNIEQILKMLGIRQ